MSKNYFNFSKLFYVSGIVLGLTLTNCERDFQEFDNTIEETTDSVTTTTTSTSSNTDTSMIYIPEELKDMDLTSSSSTWCYSRSRQSDHFIVFWGKDYGEMDPDSSAIEETYRVDIDDLLEKAESFYDVNINTLKFAEIGSEESYLDQYKMMIFLYYQDEWLATGSGYDNIIGALWVSPSTCQPVGSTIAHEIGHSFQYQVYCDLGGSAGYRYGFGNGNTFWEQCAQWQSFQCYPDEVFTNYYFSEYAANSFKHICHEDTRYSSYFIPYYWAEKHGIDIIASLWKNSEEPEDAIETYMRLTGLTDEELNDEIYDAATKFVTWDIDSLREAGEDYIGSQSFESDKLDDGSYQVTSDYCPETTGYNVIPLNVPDAGTVVTAKFTGLVNEDGYNEVDDESRAGWRYGYVALLSDGTREYGDMNEGTTNTVSYTIPSNCSNLWFVVTGAPTTYAVHEWDEDNSDDDQWPYKVNFTNTCLYGDVDLDEDATPEDLSLSFDLSFDADESSYSGTTVTLGSNDLVKIATALVMNYSDIEDLMDDDIVFYGVNSDGSLYSGSTANGYGHWFDSNGDVCNWSTSNSTLYSEFDISSYTFTIGQFPDRCSSGDSFIIKQALVYEYESGNTVQITFNFNISIN